MRQSIKITCVLSLLVFALLWPLVMGKFHTYLLTEIMIYSVFGVSYYLLLGHTGLLSFGHAAYFGLGAYSTALCLVYFPHFPVLLAIFAGSLCGLMGGLIIGSLTLRLNRMYFALGTLAFSQMFWAIAWKWRGLTGGDDGLIGWSSREIAIPLMGQFSLSNVTFLYYFVFTFAVVCILICWYFTRTPLGNTLASIKSNPNRASFLGINTSLAKLMLFSFAGLIAGASGALFILFKKMASPNFLDMFMSFDIVVISVIGGYSSFVGPIVGSFVYVYMVEYLSSFTENWQLVMGIFFVLLILFYPGGMVGIFRKFSKGFTSLRGRNR